MRTRSLLHTALLLASLPWSFGSRAPAPRPLPELVLDADGDGRADQVRGVLADGALWFDLWRAGPDGRLTLRTTQRMHPYFPGQPERWLAGDFNGDGRDDLLRLAPDGQRVLEVWCSNGDGFELTGQRTPPSAPLAGNGSVSRERGLD